MHPKSKVASGWCTCLWPDLPFNTFSTSLLGTTTKNSTLNIEKLIYWDFCLLWTELSGWSAVRNLVASGWLSTVYTFLLSTVCAALWLRPVTKIPLLQSRCVSRSRPQNQAQLFLSNLRELHHWLNGEIRGERVVAVANLHPKKVHIARNCEKIYCSIYTNSSPICQW